MSLVGVNYLGAFHVWFILKAMILRKVSKEVTDDREEKKLEYYCGLEILVMFRD